MITGINSLFAYNFDWLVCFVNYGYTELQSPEAERKEVFPFRQASRLLNVNYYGCLPM